MSVAKGGKKMLDFSGQLVGLGTFVVGVSSDLAIHSLCQNHQSSLQIQA